MHSLLYIPCTANSSTVLIIEVFIEETLLVVLPSRDVRKAGFRGILLNSDSNIKTCTLEVILTLSYKVARQAQLSGSIETSFRNNDVRSVQINYWVWRKIKLHGMTVPYGNVLRNRKP